MKKGIILVIFLINCANLKSFEFPKEINAFPENIKKSKQRLNSAFYEDALGTFGMQITVKDKYIKSEIRPALGNKKISIKFDKPTKDEDISLSIYHALEATLQKAKEDHIFDNIRNTAKRLIGMLRSVPKGQSGLVTITYGKNPIAFRLTFKKES